jgi:DNA polymerase-3 subunit gamma/tau
MSYQVIARKWRPQAFEEVTGQDHITRTLRNAIEHERLHHAYVFSGARGVGKTTTARLFAKALNCHKTAKPNPQPCKAGDADVCPSCLEITESRSIDVLEFDAASNTQVDKIREIILESINIGPARDRYKIFVIDEVHMLSSSAFNAFLKTLEEPPSYAIFILATTEKHKILPTILSRCQIFDFRRISTSDTVQHLEEICGHALSANLLRLGPALPQGKGAPRDGRHRFKDLLLFGPVRVVLRCAARDGRRLRSGRPVRVARPRQLPLADSHRTIVFVEREPPEGHRPSDRVHRCTGAGARG